MELTDPDAKCRALRDIIKTLPDWFGQPDSNAAYIDGAANRIVFASCDERKCIGLIALKIHFGRTAEIWWLGVRP